MSMSGLDDKRSGGFHQQQLEIIFNSLHDILFIISVGEDSTYRFAAVNKAFSDATDLSKEMIVGKKVDEIIPPQSHDLVFSRYKKAIDEKRTIQWEETSPYPAGMKTGVVSVTPVFENGKCSMLIGAVHDITERKQIEEEKEQIRHQLGERIKELTTLYQVSRLLQAENKSMDELLQEIVMLLPAGWQYSDITESRIVIGEKIYSTPGYAKGLKGQSAEFIIDKENKGIIEVVYCEEKPPAAEGPFLAEERKLINMLAEMLSSYFIRKGISEQVLGERDLSESIINSLPGIFYMFDENGKYLRWNKNHETITGYSREEMEQMFPLNFFDGVEKEMIRERISRVFVDGYAEAEAGFKTKDGHSIPFYFNGKAIRYNDRSYLMGVGVDMTEKRKMEEDLRHAEIKFRTLVEKSQVGVYIVQKGRFLYVNPRFAEIFGYQQSELIGADPVNTIISEEYRALSTEYVRARLAGEVESVHYEANGKRKDGSINRVEFFGSSTLYEGQPTIIGTMVDITERKKAEEALQKSEANLHTLFDTTDTMYALLDKNFCVMSFNQQAADFFKQELKCELKLNGDFVSLFPPERQSYMYENMKKVLGGQTITYDSDYHQPNGTINSYNVRMIPIRSSDSILGLMIAVSNVTEKKMMQQQILQQKVEEQKKMTRAVLNAQESERNKIGQELHDNVNQILVGAKMHLGLTGRSTESDKELIEKTIHLIDQAVNEIRALTKQQVTPRREVNLKDLIQTLADSLKETSGIEVSFVCETGKEMIKDDLKLNIYRIIQEAVNNIARHAQATEASIVVRVTGQQINIEVRDNGKGFDTAITNLRGIGLSNILNRVDSYNGSLEIITNHGQGCLIKVNIPLD